jgi:hypothetical protein
MCISQLQPPALRLSRTFVVEISQHRHHRHNGHNPGPSIREYGDLSTGLQQSDQTVEQQDGVQRVVCDPGQETQPALLKPEPRGGVDKPNNQEHRT